ncbi:MAG: DsbA family protein [Pelagimonas sp.]|jgi:protein-disulfide isomerase|nr:DsbA family protein [Pelagimonas sp.]
MLKRFSLKSALRNGAMCSALLATGAMAQGLDWDAMDADQKAAFGASVRAYLLENPQVIMEAVAVLETQEAAAQVEQDAALVAQNLEALHNDGFSWEGGNPEGDITIVEFVDYRCGYCRKAAPEVQALVEADPNIKLILKEFPILGDASVLSSRFAVATQIVAGDEAYAQVHDALIALGGKPNERNLGRMAKTLGLDADAILAEMDSEEVTRRIKETRDLANALKISGTPSFVFGSQMVRGYAPMDVMAQIVAEERAK